MFWIQARRQTCTAQRSLASDESIQSCIELHIAPDFIIHLVPGRHPYFERGVPFFIHPFAMQLLRSCAVENRTLKYYSNWTKTSKRNYDDKNSKCFIKNPYSLFCLLISSIYTFHPNQEHTVNIIFLYQNCTHHPRTL